MLYIDLMNAPAKIQAVKISIKRAEGPRALCHRAMEFVGDDCWEQANEWLLAMSPTFPSSGYDKHDFTITWANGETYFGRLDCKTEGCDGNDLDVADHVRSEAEFIAGLHRPAWMNDRQWSDCCARNELHRPEALSFLATYQIG